MFVPVFIMVIFDKIQRFFKKCFKKKPINKTIPEQKDKKNENNERNEMSKLVENGINKEKNKIE